MTLLIGGSLLAVGVLIGTWALAAIGRSGGEDMGRVSEGWMRAQRRDW